jgi:hypothetical protein
MRCRHCQHRLGAGLSFRSVQKVSQSSSAGSARNSPSTQQRQHTEDHLDLTTPTTKTKSAKPETCRCSSPRRHDLRYGGQTLHTCSIPTSSLQYRARRTLHPPPRRMQRRRAGGPTRGTPPLNDRHGDPGRHLAMRHLRGPQICRKQPMTSLTQIRYYLYIVSTD